MQDKGRPASGRDAVPAPARSRPMRRSAPRRPPIAKPPLPEERPRIGKEAFRELRASVPAGVFGDVVKAFGVAGDLLSEGDPDGALPYLAWAKAVAPRSAAVREALGIAQYQRGEFAAAAAELTAYRRMTGRADQNHLLADAARAAGRHDRVTEYVEEMARTPGLERSRVVEGLMVLAGDRADRGDLRGALAVLERAGLHPARVESWHPRVWYVAADLADRQGDTEAAREYLEAIVAVAPDFLDAGDRLAALEA